VSLLLGLVPLFLLVLAVIFFWVKLRRRRALGLNLEWGAYNFIKLRFTEGFSTLWFVSFMSSQYLIKDAVKYGARLVYVVDRGWVEIRTGQGALSRRSSVASWARSINMGVVPLLLIVGVISGVVIYVI
jgi:hypothetical protein